MPTFTVEVSDSEKYILDVNTSTADNFNKTSSQDKFVLEIQQGIDGTLEANKNIIEITTSVDSDADASSLTIEKANEINLSVSSDFVVSHPTISAASSIDNAGSLFIQDVLLDQYGHVTGLTAAYATGTGIGGGSSTFLNLTDTPSSFSGQGSKFIAVNSGGSALEFVSGVSSSSTDAFVTGISYNSASHNLVLSTHSGTVTGVLSNIIHSGDNISQLVNDSGYITGYIETGLNTFVTGLTFDSGNNNLVLQRNDSASITGQLDGVLVSGTSYHISVNGTGVDGSGRTYVQDILVDIYGHITGIATSTETVVDTNDNVFVTGISYNSSTHSLVLSRNSGTVTGILNNVVHTGDNVSVLNNDVGYLTAHPNISASSSVNNSGNVFIQDLFLDSNGHVTGISVAIATGGGDGTGIGSVLEDDSPQLGGDLDLNNYTIYGQGNINISGTIAGNGGNSSQWNTAYGWGDHSISGYVDGSGTTNYLPVFSDSDTLTNSIINQSGNTIGVNTPAHGSSFTAWFKNIGNVGNDVGSWIINENAYGNSSKNVIFESRESGVRLGVMYSYGTAYSGGSIASIGSGGTAFSSITGPVAIGPLDANKPTIIGGGINRYATIYASEFRINPSGLNQDFIIQGDSDQELFVTDASTDRVGIGTGVPEVKLHVSTATGEGTVLSQTYANNSWAGLLVRNKDNQNVASFQYGNSGVTATGLRNIVLIGSRQSGVPVKFYQGKETTNIIGANGAFEPNNERIIFDVDGKTILTAASGQHVLVSGVNLGIGDEGTSLNGAHRVPLSISPTGYAITGSPNAAQQTNKIRVYDSEGNGIAGFGVSTSSFNVATSGLIHQRFWTNALERMRITYDGNVGIGADSPGNNKLRIHHDTARYNSENTAHIKIQNSGSTIGGLIGADATDDIFYIQAVDPGTSWGKNLVAQSMGGNFGIGTISPAYKLHVSGTAGFDGGDVTINDNAGNFDFRVEGQTDSSLFRTDANLDSIGIGRTPIANYKLSINQDKNFSDLSAGGYAIGIDIDCDHVFDTVSRLNYSIGSEVSMSQTVNHGVTNSGYCMGMDTKALIRGSGTLAGAYGLRTYAGGHTNFHSSGRIVETFGIRNRVLNLGSGEMTTAYGLYSEMASYSGTYGGSIQNAYHIRLRPTSEVATSNKFGMYQEGTDDKNYFAGNVGLGTATPLHPLHVVGTGRINTLNVNGAYTFPTSDGTAGHSLVTDGAGNIVFSGVAGGGGDITAVTAGTGLSGGGTSGAVTLNIDNTVLTTGSSLNALSDVTLNSPVNQNQVIAYSSGTQQFVNSDLSIALIKKGSIPFGGYGSDQMGYYFAWNVASEAVVNDDSNDVNFRVEGTGNTHLLFVDAGTERVGINNSAPSHTLDISGMARVVHPDGLCGLQIEDEGGSGVHIGDCAYSDGDSYAGMKHTRHSGGQEYMIISAGYSTVVSSASGNSTYIRAGGNTTTYQGIFGTSAFGIGPNANRLRVNSESVIVNNGTGNYDFKVYGQNNATQLIHADAALNRVGIGTATPATKLDVNGTFSANSINVNDQFTFPTTDGSSDQVLATDGSGVLTWRDQANAGTFHYINVKKSSLTENVNLLYASRVAVRFDSEVYKSTIYSHSNVTNPERITVSEDGFYKVSATVGLDNTGANRAVIRMSIFKNGTEITETRTSTYSRGAGLGDEFNLHIDTVLQLSSSDYLEIYAWSEYADQTNNVDTVVGECEFILHKVSENNYNNVTSEYNFPNTDGEDGQVLVTNGGGVLSWENQSGGGTGSVAAWGSYNGSTNARGQEYNVSSITDNGIEAGNHTVNLLVTMSSTDYCVVVNEFHRVGVTFGTSSSVDLKSTTSFVIRVGGINGTTPSTYDSIYVAYAVFGT